MIGINAQIYSRTGGYMGMSFAIPIDVALNVKDQLMKNGKVSRSRIGVSVQDIGQQLAQTFGLATPHGALISSVEPQSPGERAGLKPGDVITSVNGQNIDHSYDLPTVISQLPPGSEAHLGVWHDRKATEVTVKTVLLEDTPAQAARNGAEDGGGRLGLAVRPLDPSEQQELHTHGRLVVEDVTGPALAAGTAGGRCGARRERRGRLDGRRAQARGRPRRPHGRALDSARGRADLHSGRYRVSGSAAAALFARAANAAGPPPAPFLPTSRAEMRALGWDACDVIIVTGDAYVDHPSFGMAIIGRVLEAQGFKVGIIAQPDWRSTEDFARLGAPRLFFGVTGGNMDSMVNRYTADRRVRSDDAYTPGGAGGKRPGSLRDRVLAADARGFQERTDRDRRHRGEPAAHRAFRLLVGPGAPLGARRRARRTCWSTATPSGRWSRSRSGSTRASRSPSITDLRGTAFLRRAVPEGWVEIDSTELDTPGPLAPPPDPYASEEERRAAQPARCGPRAA